MSSDTHLTPTRDRGFRLWCGVSAAAALVLDQWTKIHAEAAYMIAPPWPTMAHHRSSTAILADFHIIQLKITHVANAGVVLGLLEETLWPLPVIAFYGASALTIVAATALLRLGQARKRLARAAAFALLVGVLGNMIDRLRLGYVVDWFYAEAHFASRSFDIPAFNVADLALVVGAALAALHFAKAHLRKRPGSVTSRRIARGTEG
jgi:signal peptidase II